MKMIAMFSHKITAMRRIFTLIILSAICVLSTNAQDVDSLYALFCSARQNESVRLAREIVSLAKQKEITADLPECEDITTSEAAQLPVLQSMAAFSAAKTDYRNASIYAERALALAQQVGDMRTVSRIYCGLANICQRCDQIEKAVDCYMKSIETAKNAGDHDMEAATLSELGRFHLRKNRDADGMTCLQKALALARKTDNKPVCAKTLGTIGEFYLQNDSLDAAMDAINESLAICREIGTPFFIEAGLCRLGMAQTATGQFAEAEKNLLAALEICRTFEDKNSVTFDLMALGNLKREQNLTAEADRYYRQSVETAENLGNYNMLSVLYDKLYTLHRHSNPTLSLQYLEKGIAVDDSLYTLEMHDQIANYQIRYETAEKQLEIERQKHVIERRNIERVLFIIGLITVAVILILVWRMLRYRTRRNRILHEMNVTKDKFFSIISHDLRNPAVAQRNALKLLVTNAQRWDADTVQEYLNELLRSADSQVDLLFNLLNWAQIQTGRMAFCPRRFDLVSALRPEVTLCQKIAQQKNISLTTTLPDEAIVFGDQNMLATVVRNLMTNAVKFTGEKGEIELEISTENKEKFSVSIKDTGLGMSAEQISALFRIDRQQSRDGTAGEKGSGLGLVVCHELLEKHGTTLKVESEPGQGSKFWFEIEASAG